VPEPITVREPAAVPELVTEAPVKDVATESPALAGYSPTPRRRTTPGLS
jgi:hypothetical protein